MDTHNEFDDRKSSSDDDFGLPNIDYDPLPSEDPPHGVDDEPYSFPDEDEEGGSNTALIVTIVIVLVLLLGGLGYFFILKPMQEKQRQEQLAREKRNEERRERERLAQQQREEEMARQKAIADSIAQASAPPSMMSGGDAVSRGTVTTLDGPTGMYHVVISSALDDDLLRDYAKKLSRQGVSTKIISPYGQVKFHRLVMADDYQTYALAQQKAGQVGGQYQGSAWVLRY